MRYILLLCTLFYGSTLISQEYNYTISSDNVMMSQGEQPCYILTISDADDDLLEKVWSHHVKEEGSKLKKDRKTKEYHAEEFTFVGSDKTYELISSYSKNDDQTEVMIWLLDPEGDFLDPTDEESEAFEDLLDEVAYKVKIKGIEDEVDDEEDKLHDLNKDLEKLKKKKENMEEEIDDCEKRIKNNNDDIENFTKAKQAIELQMNPTNEEGTPVVRLSEKELKDLEKDIKKRDRDIKRNRRQIERCEDKIRDNNKDIPRNLDEQDKVSQQIALQQEIVEAVRTRLIDAKDEKK